MALIPKNLETGIITAAQDTPVIMLKGARQTGKKTLMKGLQKKIFGLGAIFAILTCAGCAGFGLSSDEELIDRFNKHRSEFNELVTTFSDEREILVFRSNGMHTYNDLSIVPRKGDSEKLQKYSDLLEELRLESVGMTGTDSSAVKMITNTRGLYDEGEAKGYLFSRRKLQYGTKIRDSLNSFPVQTNGWYARPIAKNWFLFLDVTR